MKYNLVFATHNNHKTEEIKKLMESWADVKSLSDIGYSKEIPETGATLEDNALQKAWHVFSKLGVDCFADDTGLEVEALSGAPGVYSARYASENATYAENTKLLIANMAGEQNRKARFRTVIYLILNGKKWLFEGSVSGTILTESRGEAGFGYDPIFLPDGFDKTFAEMTIQEKNGISHRGRAIQKMMNFFEAQQSGTSLAGQGEFS